MRTNTILLFLVLITAIGCKDKPSVITIIDIGKNDRLKIGEQLKIVHALSPKLIGLDFFLVPDSSDRDSIIVNQLNKSKKVIAVVGLQNFNDSLNYWNDLKKSHEKFKITDEGFANLTGIDLVVDNSIPVWSTHKDDILYSFSYMVALNSFGLKSKYKETRGMEIPFDFNLANKNYTIINQQDFLIGNFKKEDIANKIILLGYIGNDEDYFFLSFLNKNRNNKINGVELHAMMINELIDY